MRPVIKQTDPSCVLIKPLVTFSIMLPVVIAVDPVLRSVSAAPGRSDFQPGLPGDKGVLFNGLLHCAHESQMIADAGFEVPNKC